MTMKNIVRLLSLAAVACALAVPASAQWGIPASAQYGVADPAYSQPGPEEERNCFTGGKGSNITISAQGGDGFEDSSKLQQYETFPKGVFLPCANFSWTNDKDYFIDAVGTKLGLDDQFASVLVGKKGGFKLGVLWDQNPNWQSNTARTPYTEVAPGVLRVPDGMSLALQNVYVPWVAPTATSPSGVGSAPANPTVPGFYAVEPWVQESYPIDLRYVRKTGRVGLTLPVGEALAFNINYSRETRDGNKNTTFYGGPDYEVATPVNFQTDIFHIGGEYAKGRFFLGVSADFSNFKNEVPFVEIDNPERLELNNPGYPTARTVYNDASFFRLWMYPDNKAYQVDATGGFTLPARNKLTASLSTGNMKMDTALREISTNPDLGTQPVNPLFTIVPPYGSVEAKYDTFMAQLKLTGDPNRWFGYILSWRKFELEDKTDDYTFTSTVRGDVGASYNATGFTREHEGWSIESLRGEIHVIPVRGLRLGASYGQDKRQYDIREYADVTDDVFTLTADYSSSLFQFHGAWSTLDRKPGDPNEEAIPPTWQGATQTDITERNRHILSGLVTFTPTSRLTVAVNGARTTNEFAESVTGLLDQSSDTFGIDATFAASDKVSLWAGYVYEKYFFDMAAAYIPRGLSPPYDPANLWGNQTEDKIDTFRVGLDWALVPDKVDLAASLDYTKPRSDSQYDFAEAGTPIGGLNEANGVFPANVPPLAGFPVTTFDSFPLVEKEFLIAKIRLAYHLSKNLTASAMYWKQKYDNTDWQTNNPGANGEPYTPYMGKTDPGSNRWFFLGAHIPSYDANIFRASLTYTF